MRHNIQLKYFYHLFLRLKCVHCYCAEQIHLSRLDVVSSLLAICTYLIYCVFESIYTLSN
jgi:hypothetical protein